MSRIYSNDALTSLPVNTHHVDNWCEENLTRSGNGVLLEGCACFKSRHMFVSKGGNKHRYYVIYVDVKRAHHRKFDNKGKETTPNFSEKGKVSTGYLMSSYKITDKGKSDSMTREQVDETVVRKELREYTRKYLKHGLIDFWIEEKFLEQVEIMDGDDIRVKTKQDSPFIENIVRIEERSKTVANMAGDEQVGASWTDKVLMNKSTSNDSCASAVEGVDEDEWDD